MRQRSLQKGYSGGSFPSNCTVRLQITQAYVRIRKEYTRPPTALPAVPGAAIQPRRRRSWRPRGRVPWEGLPEYRSHRARTSWGAAPCPANVNRAWFAARFGGPILLASPDHQSAFSRNSPAKNAALSEV